MTNKTNLCHLNNDGVFLCMFMARYAAIFLCHLIFMTFDIYDKGILNKQRAFSCFGGFTDPLKILKTSLP